MTKTASGEKRAKIKEEFFGDDDAWTGEKEKGWFRAPRTLPLILDLLSSKQLSGRLDPSKAYLELLARHIDSGLVEMTDEGSHAYAAGYSGTRAVRTWQERMKKLQEIGFIKTKQIGNRKYAYVLLVHPTVAIQRLKEANKIGETWYDTFRARQIEVKDNLYEEREQRNQIKLVPPVPLGKKAVSK
jgi:hypothetical protein